MVFDTLENQREDSPNASSPDGGDGVQNGDEEGVDTMIGFVQQGRFAAAHARDADGHTARDLAEAAGHAEAAAALPPGKAKLFEAAARGDAAACAAVLAHGGFTAAELNAPHGGAAAAHAELSKTREVQQEYKRVRPSAAGPPGPPLRGGTGSPGAQC